MSLYRFLGCCLLMLLTACSDSNDGSGGDSLTNTLRNQRYCELLAVSPAASGLEADVWNTFSLNDCPADDWEAISDDDLADFANELGALIVLRNGPRFWLMDDILNNRGSYRDIRFFESLEMGLAATLLLPPNPVQTPYTERRVERDTSFTFNQDSENYVLRSPDNKAYVMQSYSHIVDDSLSLDTLPGLATRLALPPGWTFSVLTLEEDLVVEDIAGIATVVQDEFQNTYQQTLALQPHL